MSLEFGNDALFEDFLHEVQALDDFRAEYGGRYGFENLGRDDQDVRRMMEAMAYYSARTRGVAERAVRRHKRQILEQLFPHLLTPMPAMAMMYPLLGANMLDARILPEGADVLVQNPAIGQDPFADARTFAHRHFRTTREQTVYPLHIVAGSVRLERQRNEDARSRSREPRWTLFVRIAASKEGRGKSRYYQRGARALDELRLHINPRGDVPSALRLYSALQHAADKMIVRVRSQGEVRHERVHTFPVGSVDPERTSWSNPIEDFRRLLHFPLANLYLPIPMSGTPAEWDFLDVELALNAHWPAGLAVADESFVLNAMPVENSVRGLALPIVYDGTRTRWRIQHPEPDAGYQLREVLGVYLLDPKNPGVRQPLLPGSLVPWADAKDGDAATSSGYALDVDGRGDQRAAYLEIDGDLGAPSEPRTIHVDAEWYQPLGPPLDASSAVVSIEDHDSGPVAWQLLAPVSLPADSPVLANSKGLNALLELHGKNTFDLGDLKQLLVGLGSKGSEVFSRVPQYFRGVRRVIVPDSESIQGSLVVYDITCAEPPPAVRPALELLGAALPALLATWTGHSDIRVSIAFDERPEVEPLVFEVRNR